MEDLSAIAQFVDALTTTAILLWILTLERRDHRDTRSELEAVHREHKKDLRNRDAPDERIPAEYE